MTAQNWQTLRQAGDDASDTLIGMLQTLDDQVQEGGGGSASDVTVDPAVAGETNVQDALEALESGGSQAVVVVNLEVAFDTPGFQIESFAIGGVFHTPEVFTLSFGALAIAAFPPAGTFTVTGSTGNDGTYTVVSSEASSDDLDVTVVETIPDDTVDGQANGPEQSGVILYTPAVNDVPLFIMPFIPTAFAGNNNPTIEVGWPDDRGALVGAAGVSGDSPYNAHFANFQGTGYDAASGKGRFTDTTPVRVCLDNASGLYPAATEGEALIQLVVAKATP